MNKVAGYITRKTMLYQTGVEYGDYTMNHVQGCAHGCLYPCYAFLQKKRFGQVKTYDDWLKPYLVENTLDLLRVEIPKLKDKIQSVQLCFTTDPFMYEYDEICKMSLDSIELLNSYGIKCTVLTKGVLPVELANGQRYSDDNEYGITLITLDENYRKQYEPGGASITDRLAGLKALHDEGKKTWVSIEPYPTPNLINQDLKTILDAVSFTDRIIFGRTNYSKAVTQGYPNHKKFYNDMAALVIDYCKSHDISYHIKEKTLS